MLPMHCKSKYYPLFKWAITLVIALYINNLLASDIHPILQHDADKSIFIDVAISKPTVFVGETLTVQYLLYYSKSIVDPQNDVNIKFNDCFVEKYPIVPVADKLINGKNYHVMLLEKVLLIPQFEGKLNIPAINIQLKINQPATKNNFFGTEQSIDKEFSSSPKQVKVLALPSSTGSIPFAGAIGRFKLNYKFINSDKTANLLKVIVNITGYGNVKFAHWVPPAVPPGIDIFNINNKETGKLVKNDIKANQTFSFDLVANFRGNFTIPKITFLAFDPDGSKYVEYETSVYHWKVDKGLERPGSLVKGNSSLKNTPFLYTKMADNVAGNNRLFFGSKAFYFLIACGITLFFIGAVNLYSTKIKEDNPAAYYFKIAKKQAIKKIQRLKINAGDVDDDMFYKDLYEILQTYMCYKTGIALQELSFEHIIKRLRSVEVPDDILTMVTFFIKEKYGKRFSPMSINICNRDSDCRQLSQIVKSLDIYIK
jgi:hypothetical protein